MAMRLWVEPVVLKEIARLPGHIRARIRRALAELPDAPRPGNSRALDVPDDIALSGVEARRLRIENWRILYTIDDEWDIITIIALRKRPPYNYDDLHDLLN